MILQNFSKMNQHLSLDDHNYIYKGSEAILMYRTVKFYKLYTQHVTKFSANIW